MAPRLTSFKSIWNKVQVKNDIENSTSPVRSSVPKKNPLISAATNITPIHPQGGGQLKFLFNRQVIRPRSGGLSGSNDIIDHTPSSSDVADGIAISDNYPSNIPSTSTELHIDELYSDSKSEPPQKHFTVGDSNGRCYIDVESVLNSHKSSASSAHSDDEIVFRALIATDTHLGFKHSDQFRNNDAINTFEEILFLAKHLNVDAIFHSGDMFDEIHPPRTVIYKAMELLSEYLNRDDPIQNDLEVELGNLRTSTIMEEDDFNIEVPSTSEQPIRIPFFVIHGNHDYPTEPYGLSPIDILNVANLVTYMGKAPNMDCIVLEPVLLTKRNVKIALYGLGWIQDEKLYQLLRSEKVIFTMPENPNDYYKILLFHQNRFPRRGKSSNDYIHESMLPDWFDLVIWGHEHECFKVPAEVIGVSFQLLQLGSSIQTALVPGEAVPKHVCLMELSDDKAKFYPISLETARRLLYSELDLDALGPTSEEQVLSLIDAELDKLLKLQPPKKTEICYSNVYNAVSSADNIFASRHGAAIKRAESRPLVRIRVTYNGGYTISPRVLTAAFTDKVANPSEIVRFKNRRQVLQKNHDPNVPYHMAEFSQENINDIVFNDVLTNANCKIILEDGLTEAVRRFAVGGEVHAITENIQHQIEASLDYLNKECFEHISKYTNLESCLEAIQQAVVSHTQLKRMSKPRSNEHVLARGSDNSSSVELNVDKFRLSSKDSNETNYVHLDSSTSSTANYCDLTNGATAHLRQEKLSVSVGKRPLQSCSTPKASKLLVVPDKFISPKQNPPSYRATTLSMFFKK